MPPARRKVVAEVEPSATPGAPAAPVVDLRVGTSPNNAPNDSATHGVFADPAIVSAAPLARGFALPAAVQARLAALHGAGGAPLQVHVETGSAPSAQAGAPVVLPRHQPLEQLTATAPTEDAEVDLSHLHATSTTAGARPLIFSRRWNHRQQRHEVESETITTTFGAPGRGGRGRGGRAGTTSAPQPMRENAGDAAFANSSDDVIRFGQRLPSGWHNDDAPASASSSSSSEEDVSEVGELPKDPAGRRRELARRKRHRDRVDRHLNDIEEGLKDDVEGSGDSSSSGSDEEGAADMMLFHHHQEGDEDNEEQQLPLPTRGGARPLFAQAEAESATLPTTAHPEEEEPTLSGRRSFGPMMYEQHLNSSAEHPCYHTLVQLTGPMTLRGPCGLVGMGLGETSVGGFLLGRKQLVLWSADHKVVAMPMRRLKSKQSQRAELPRWDKLQRYDEDATPGSSDDFVAMNVAEAKQAMHKARRGRGTSGAEEASELSDSDDDDWQTSHQYDVQSVFGTVDWPWVLDTVRRWTAAIPANERPSVVLVLQSYSPGIRPTWKYFTQRTETNPRGERSRRSGDANEESSGSPSDPDAYVEVPSFVARRSAQSIDLALLPQIIPTIAAQNSGCVAVLGSVNIGKSTLCRYLANLFISQHGLCYWLDLDMGQPEFGVPGQIGLFLIRQPLMEANDQRCVQLVRSFFLGSTSVQCPVSTGKAIAAMCDYCRPIAADHPMVVNTHGWVLSTGRRTTVEMLRRLQPRHVLHLLLPQEEDWTHDTAALMEPQHGLNAGVLGRRFLVRDGEGTGRLLGQLPHPYPSMPGAEGGAATSTTWRGQVHSVRVSRSGPGGRAPAPAKQKGSVARQSRWQTYMTPLLLFFAAQQSLQPQRLPSLSRRRTTLLQAPLSALYRIIVVEMDEKQPREGGGAGSGRGGPPRGRGRDRGAGRHAPPPSSLSLDVRALVAGLEHSVVALQLHPVGEPRPSPPVGPPPVVSLAALPRGFTVTCYGYVESVEQTLSGEGPTLGQIAIRVPLECAVLEWMLSMGQPSATQPPTPVAISLALSPSIQKDVAFLDQQHTA